jgi:predicted ATPase/DNA-binding XRE family transcriptional regulator
VPPSFGQLLRQFRTAAGLSQEQLADLARISVESVGALERGTRRAPYRETVAVLVDALKLDAGERGMLEAAANAARARGTRNSVAANAPAVNPNLPLQSTSFIGRAQDIADITALLQENRLVTVTGSGGVGKTRVVVEVAMQLPGAVRSEVRFVDLSPLSDSRLIIRELASRLGVSLADTVTATEALVAALRSTRMLVVLDNCEHVIADIALLVSAILRSCPQISFLATSRERLAVGGEVVYRLPSLEVPDRPPAGIERARRYAALDLFMQRATLGDRSVIFGDDSIADIVEVCRQLDGIPLAIELAAARLPTLGLESLRTRLSQGIVVAGGARNLPARQQTMLATIGWSFDLLDSGEKTVLQRTSVFVGGFTLAAAEAVCAGNDIDSQNVANVLSSLVEKSLINVALSNGRARYSILESVKAFAQQRLTEAGEAELLSLRHAEWLAAFADWIDTTRVGKPEPWLRAETAPELENARAALSWAFQTDFPRHVLLAGRIIGGLRTIWLTSGRRSECARWAKAALTAIDEERHLHIVARLLRAIVQAEDGAERFEWAKRALLVFNRIGDLMGVALLHQHLANEYRKGGRLDEALTEISRASEILASLPRSMPHAAMLQNRWQIYFAQNRYEDALSDIAEGLSIVSSLGDRDAFIWKLFQTQVEFAMGQREQAIRDLDTVLDGMLLNPSTYGREIIGAYTFLGLYRIVNGDLEAGVIAVRELLVRQRWGEGVDEHSREAMHVAALAAAMCGEGRLSAKLLGAAEHHYGLPLRTEWRYLDDMLMPRLRERLTVEQVTSLQAEGGTQPLDTLIAEALRALTDE